MDSSIVSGITSSVTPSLQQSLQGLLSTSMLLSFGLWISYFTIVTSANGTSFYQYGWEGQLLETGYFAIFLCRNFWPKLLLHIC